MKCPACGAKLPDDAKFCSYCGAEIDAAAAPFSDVRSGPAMYQPKLSAYEKILAVSVLLFTLLCLIAFLAGKPGAGILALMQIAMAAISFFIKKEVIRGAKAWLSIPLLAASFFLLAPYAVLLTSAKTERLDWNEIVLGNRLPAPEINRGQILSNSADAMLVHLYHISPAQYAAYLDACEETGFSVEAEKTGDSFDAFNPEGYKLSLRYFEDKSELHILFDAPETFDAMQWPDTGLARLIPAPDSSTGKIETNTDSGFKAYVSGISQEKYRAYVLACAEAGFNAGTAESDRQYFAKNADGYQLTVDYQGNEVIGISIAEPEYTIELQVDCAANLLFNKYDVTICVDGAEQGTIRHGATEYYTLILTKGPHTIQFASAEDDEVKGQSRIDAARDGVVCLRLSCAGSRINVDTISDSAGAAEPEHSEDAETPEPEGSTPSAGDAGEPEGNISGASSEDASSGPVYYSTNGQETAKNGNSGVFSYIGRRGTYDLYYIIDFDGGYVYYFSEGMGDTTCDRVKIVSGDLNHELAITWHDGDSVWSYKLYFKQKNQPGTLILQDNDGFKSEYEATELSEALSLRDSKRIVDY